MKDTPQSDRSWPSVSETKVAELQRPGETQPQSFPRNGTLVAIELKLYVLDCSGRRPVLTASRKAACKPLPDNEIVPETDIKSNICQLLHHGILPELHLFHRQIYSTQLTSQWKGKSLKGWFCVENRQNILRQDSRLPPTLLLLLLLLYLFGPRSNLLTSRLRLGTILAASANQTQCYGHVGLGRPMRGQLAEWGRHFARAAQSDRLSMRGSHLGATGKIVSRFEVSILGCFWPLSWTGSLRQLVVCYRAGRLREFGWIIFSDSPKNES